MIHVFLEHRATALRERQRLTEPANDIGRLFDQEKPTLTARVRRLQDRRQRNRLGDCARIGVACQDCVPGLRHSRVAEPRTHCCLVGHRARNLDADVREAERVRDLRSREYGPVARDR
jgi:hypothetical protein